MLVVATVPLCFVIVRSTYRIQSNYRTVRSDISKLLNKLVININQIRALFKERSAEDLMRSILNDVFAILFSDFLYKSICWVVVVCVCVGGGGGGRGYSFELPRLVEASQMSYHTICFNKKVDKSTLTVI